MGCLRAEIIECVAVAGSRAAGRFVGAVDHLGRVAA